MSRECPLVAPNPSQAERLREALRQTKLARRRLAILLQEQQPERSLENIRRQLNKWIKDDGKGWSDETSERLSAAFRTAGHAFHATYFMKDPNQEQTWAQEMADLAQRQASLEHELRAKLEEFERKVDALLKTRRRRAS